MKKAAISIRLRVMAFGKEGGCEKIKEIDLCPGKSIKKQGKQAVDPQAFKFFPESEPVFCGSLIRKLLAVQYIPFGE
ncbi:MAG: hypothetical protein ABFS02_12035 [Pseudomonadota bacterium]